jgi:hypothetical protein
MAAAKAVVKRTSRDPSWLETRITMFNPLKEALKSISRVSLAN